MSATDFGDPNQIIHIPAHDLTGTREAKLAELDMLLAQLQVVRLALCGQPLRLEAFVDATGQQAPLRSKATKTLHAILSGLGLRSTDQKSGRS